MRHLHGAATASTPAGVTDCVELARRVEDYPSWHPEVVKEVVVRARTDSGLAQRAAVTLRLSLGPLRQDFPLTMALIDRGPDEIVLERVPHDPDDKERFLATWRFEAVPGGGTNLRFEIEAQLDVPRLLPVGSVADDMATSFVKAACSSLQKGR